MPNHEKTLQVEFEARRILRRPEILPIIAIIAKAQLMAAKLGSLIVKIAISLDAYTDLVNDPDYPLYINGTHITWQTDIHPLEIKKLEVTS